MKKVLALAILAFSTATFASGMSGGSTVTTPYIICMQDGKMLGATAMPVYECTKLKKAAADKAN
ncbi:hypothetical protein ABT56_00165 [Photobacterium aquae]|uniref:DUF333 domain-containing protein n=1 Tax=Photobacterium aquae TaxID=1195763 RepID=A0A0J1HD40_9GAMM|nr:hypothetical protein [Photobacterium aquae]KLV09546.1 hypothetical protein ABT56_00165 [Photobacterium aquae]